MARNSGRPPIINAPPWVTGIALVLLAAHAIRVFLPSAMQDELLWETALFPERFWGWAGASMPPGAAEPYSNALTALATLLTTGLVHSDWVHVGLNSAMLLGVGKPVYEYLERTGQRERNRAGYVFLLLFLVSVAGGSVAHLAATYPAGPPAIGASGGVSGLIAAVLLAQQGARPRLLSRTFLGASLVFLVANVVLALVGPSMMGASIAWQAHVGGYVAGALMCRFVIWRREGLAA
ncbi:rhomboid family intramembrane serine protease [Hyphomonas oceanitis]|uniref:S54 family peptidase n=1 Tax=Hyphomonas oceanitis SCH89 TaxID=1280953 RepID=A0A059G2E5_9PROT|nr:rhomboid family intramembrane serine protease [Hyphomonas oceanitis]KDA00971.1 S54 family peptidase [Hyphomonas oceanitis SCH89]